MKLHANATHLSEQPQADRSSGSIEEGWSLTAAAEAAGVSERTAAQVAGALARRGRGRACSIARSAPQADPAPDARRSGSRRSRRCGGCG